MIERYWAPLWETFLEAHSRWWQRISNAGPVYWVPEEVVASLSEDREDDVVQKRRARPALVSPEDAAAEKEFRRICMAFNRETVGVWDEQPLSYALLNPAPTDFDVPEALLDEWAAAGFLSKAAARSSLALMQPRLKQQAHQQLGYVGWLNFKEQYRQDRLRLESQWSQLPERPPLNVGSGALLGPPGHTAKTQKGPMLPPPVAKFYDELAAFLQRWGLANLVTWDLPVPQGPLEMATAGLVSRLRGPDESVTYIPDHYDAPSNYDLREATREGQRRRGVRKGIREEFPLTDTSARGDRASRWETAFRMWLIEESLRRRYGALRGVPARLEPVFAELFGVSLSRVPSYRRTYLSYLSSGE